MPGAPAPLPGPEAFPPNLFLMDPAPELDVESVKETIKTRLTIHRLGRSLPPVENAEIHTIFDLKDRIVQRMEQLNPDPFWANRRLNLIRDYLQPPRGGEFTIPTLEKKLEQLFSANPEGSVIYKQLLRAKENLTIFQ